MREQAFMLQECSTSLNELYDEVNFDKNLIWSKTISSYHYSRNDALQDVREESSGTE